MMTQARPYPLFSKSFPSHTSSIHLSSTITDFPHVPPLCNLYMLVDKLLENEEKRQDPRLGTAHLKIAKELLNKGGTLRIHIASSHPAEVHSFLLSVMRRVESTLEKRHPLPSELIVSAQKLQNSYLRLAEDRQSVSHEAKQDFFQAWAEFTRLFLLERIGLLAQTYAY